jgi:hypothetical protein
MSTSMVTRCITTTSASPYYSISLLNNSGSPTISVSTDSSSKSLSATSEASVFNSSISKTSVSTLSAKSNTSTSDYVSPTPKMPISISLLLAKNTTTTLPYVTSQSRNSTSTSSSLSLAISQIRNSTSTSSSLLLVLSQIRNSTSTLSSTAITATSKSVTSNLTPLAESLLSSAFKTTTSTSVGPVCTSGGSCTTYNCVACPGGNCFCGIDSSSEPNCFHDESCNTKCSTIHDCSPGEGCLVDSCCGSDGYCISIAKDPSWCNNVGNSKHDHGGGWQGIWQGSTSCQAFQLL